jgi:hypothetical protein
MPAVASRALRRKQAVHACRRALCWTFGILIAYFTYQYNSFTIFAYLPTGGDILLPLTLTFLILATLLYVIYIAIRYLKTPYAQAFYPLILYCSAYILFNPAQAFDHDRHSVCARFQQQREQFVHSFCAGEMPLQAVHPKVYVPPKSLRYTAGLSHNVSIDCQDDRIIAAFPLLGYLDHSEELMYRSDGSLPEPQSQSGIQDYDKIKQNWYYVVY